MISNIISHEGISHILGYHGGKYIIIDMVPFLLVEDDVWDKLSEGKKQPSQSYSLGEKSFVLMKMSYFVHNIYFWIEHEVGHCKFYFSHPQYKDDTSYPCNDVEKYAFSYQISAMRKKGLGRWECFEIIRDAYEESSGWDEEKEKFIREILKI